MQRGTVILIKVKSCNALLHLLLVCISAHLKSVLRYKFLIWVPIIWTLHFVSKDVIMCNYILKPKRGWWGKKLGKYCITIIIFFVLHT
jgi:hypothetical protein